MADKFFQDELKRLRDFTKDCHDDMHEPDEQNISAEFGPHVYKFGGEDSVLHTSFDNACTAEMSYDMGFWLIKKGKYPDGSGEDREWFNLACIVALARKAKL